MKKIWAFLCLATLVFLTACSSMSMESSQSSSASSSTSQTSEIDWDKAGPDAKANKISFAMVKEDVEQNGAKFYDVRSQEEFEAGNFGITENFPITDLQAGKLPDLAKDTPIYIHCLKGIRSAQATQILREAGFTKVYDMGGVEHVKAIGGVLSN